MTQLIKDKGRGKGKIVALGLLAGIILAVIFVATRQAPPRDNTAINMPTVNVIAAQALPFLVEARGHGVASPTHTWQAIANVPGRVVYRNPQLHNGALLPAGTPLLEIDPSRYELAEAQALGELESLKAEQVQLDTNHKNTEHLLKLEQERLQLLEKELVRFKSLVSNGSATQSQYDEVERNALAQRKAVQSLQNQLQLTPSSQQRLKAQIERAKARLEQTRKDLADTRFVAPYEIRIAKVNAELHQYVGAGQMLLQADSIATAEVVAQVPMARLRFLVSALQSNYSESETLDLNERLDFSAIEAQVTLTDDPSVQWPARVVRIARGLNPNTRAAQVIVEIDQPYRTDSPSKQPILQPDMYVQVRLSARLPEPQIVIPATAIHQGEVYLVDDEQRLQRRAVNVVFEQNDMAIVSEGLAEGEQVIVDDLSPAINGLQINPILNKQTEQQLQQKAAGAAL